MAENTEDDKRKSSKTGRSYNTCPNCGHELSPWQQVLLTVDRALVCRNCWYRIILDTSEDEKIAFPPERKG